MQFVKESHRQSDFLELRLQSLLGMHLPKSRRVGWAGLGVEQRPCGSLGSRLDGSLGPCARDSSPPAVVAPRSLAGPLGRGGGGHSYPFPGRHALGQLGALPPPRERPASSGWPRLPALVIFTPLLPKPQPPRMG